MATSITRPVFKKLTYVDSIKEQITNSGGTIIYIKDNIIMASEISEAQYRELLKNPYIDKMDVLPLKRYKNEGKKYIQSEINANLKEINTLIGAENIQTTNSAIQSTGGGGQILPSVGGSSSTGGE